MDDVVTWRSLSITLFVLLLALILGFRIFFWPFYVEIRDDLEEARTKLETWTDERCGELRQRLEIVTQQRDGWKQVADQAQFVAQLGIDTARRATRTVQQVVP